MEFWGRSMAQPRLINVSFERRIDIIGTNGHQLVLGAFERCRNLGDFTKDLPNTHQGSDPLHQPYQVGVGKRLRRPRPQTLRNLRGAQALIDHQMRGRLVDRAMGASQQSSRANVIEHRHPYAPAMWIRLTMGCAGHSSDAHISPSAPAAPDRTLSQVVAAKGKRRNGPVLLSEHCLDAVAIPDTARRIMPSGLRSLPRALSDRTVVTDPGSLLRKHRIAAVPHRFRSSFRDWAEEKPDHLRLDAHGAAVGAALLKPGRHLRRNVCRGIVVAGWPAQPWRRFGLRADARARRQRWSSRFSSPEAGWTVACVPTLSRTGV